MRTWTDFKRTSVLHLDGSNAELNPHAVPRLVVSLEDSGEWIAFAVTAAEPLVRFGGTFPGRSEAKRALVSAVLRAIHEDAARPAHAELSTVQPAIEEAHAASL